MVLPRYARLDEVGDAPALLVAAVDRAVEVLRNGLHLCRVLDRSEVDHHVQGCPAQRGLRHERSNADVARSHGTGARDAALARAKETPRGLGDLEWHPRRCKERGLPGFLACLLLLFRFARELHCLGDTGVRRAVIVNETEKVRAEVVGLLNEALKRF